MAYLTGNFSTDFSPDTLTRPLSQGMSIGTGTLNSRMI